MSDFNLSTTQEQKADAPAIMPEGKPEVQKETKQETQVAPAQDGLGRQFMALDKRRQALNAREQELKAKAEQLQSREQQWSELDKLSALEIVQRVAQRKGTSDEEIIKSYIAAQTGQPSAEQSLKESKDPAVQALAAKLEAQAKANEALQKKLQEKEQLEQRLQVQTQIQAVQNECLQSATTSWSEESDYPLFFADQADLAKSVFQYCAARVQQYEKENGFSPEDSDIAELIKAAPQLLLQEQLQSPRGQRIANLRTAQKQQAKEKERVQKPRMSVPIQRPAVVDKGNESSTSNSNRPRNERLDRDAQKRRAIERLEKQYPGDWSLGTGGLT